MAPRPVLDVSGLPGTTLDHRNSVWWGNTLLIAIETMSVALLVGSYFYLQRNFELWPPPRVDRDPPIFEPFPDLTASTLNLLFMLVIAAGCVILEQRSRRLLIGAPSLPPPMEPGARRGREDLPLATPRTARRFAAAFFLLALGALVCSGIRFLEFPGLYFRWNENAYASIIWSMLGLHLVYLLTSAVEFLLLGIWISRRGLTEKFATDLTLATATWYWVVAIWVVLYLVVYWSPRILG
jgi:cytochrome c oxidase subunit III